MATGPAGFPGNTCFAVRLLTRQFFAVLVLLAVIAVAPASSWGLATGDGSWQWVNPSVQGNTMRSLSFVDANTGWAAGDGGTILKTTDGGGSWNAQIPSPNTCAGSTPYGSGCNLKGVSFVDANNGWAVGAYGTIWHTINGGSSWTAQVLPGSLTYASLYGVHFINSSVGVAVGPSYAFATRDGGITWVKVNNVNTAHSLNAVQMLDSSNAVAVGDNGVVYKINWSGSAWAATLQTTPGTQTLISLCFYNGTSGFAVGGGRIWRTADSGVTWAQNTTPRTENLKAVTMTGNTLVVTGGSEVFGEYAGSSVILTRTSASIWTEDINTVASGLAAAAGNGTTDQLLAVTFPGGSSTGYAAGEAGGIVKTTDTGSNWTLKAGGNGKRYTDSSFVNDTTGWMVAMDGSVAKTTDSGGSWTSDASGIAAGTKLRGVSFLDASTGFAVGYSGLLGYATNTGVAYKYVSGTWSAMSVPAGVATLEAVHMTSATSGWAVGRAPGDTGVGAGVALKTTDGSNWVFDNIGINGNIRLYGVDSTSASNGWAVGENVTSRKAVLLKYTAGAPGSWTVTEKTDAQGLLGIDMVNSSTGYAVGYVSPSPTNPAYNQEGRIYKTTDGGITWNNISPANTQFRFLVDVSFFDTNTGYVVASEGGRILKTTNGGASWTVESSGVGCNIKTVSVVPSAWSAPGYIAFAAGDNASILRSPGSLKAITSFTIPGQTGLTTINQSTHTIALHMPYGTDVTNMVPNVTIAGASVSPASGTAQNFTSPGTYTVTAADASAQAYTVTVTIDACPGTRPDLSLSRDNVRWASYADYTARLLTVDMTIHNNGFETAYNVNATGAVNTNGVITVSSYVAGGSAVSGRTSACPACQGGSAVTTIVVQVPVAVSSFYQTVYASAQDVCGNIYEYPGPNPGA